MKGSPQILAAAGIMRLLAAGVLVFVSGCAAPPPPQLVSAIHHVPAVMQRAAAYDLVRVADACPGILLRLRYATRDNFVRRAVYPKDMPCLLHRSTAAKLRAAQQGLAPHGLRLVIWDAWRPPEVQQVFWDLIRNPDYVARPGRGEKWSWHNHGRAVDVTLADAHGNLLPMPTDFDDFSPRAKADYAGTDARIAHRVRLLQAEMLRAGFERLDSEWWHFSDTVDPRPPRPVFGADLGLTAQAPP
ncbi:MAG: M15 family metallopeptidase [Verrucomicrobiales bacterium]|nr:M15 family metallopeptidase [Verrucomicrobiales bacterium]